MKAVSVENVSKKFILRHDRPKNLADGLRSMLARTKREDFWALTDVNFHVDQGEAVGIIGHNGAGKSTMLKILTGIMDPTKGRIRTRGRVSALIEVGAGFHPEMTGRENVYLNGTILGMSRAEITSKLDAIVAFAELEAFIDTPVKRYSSGMYARLGFAVAAHVDPQVLLVDEVLAVGDLPFQLKCFRHMQSLVDKGCAVILVTHSMYSAKQLCSRLVWIHEGKVRVIGDADSIATEYQNWAGARSLQGGGGGAFRWGSGDATISQVSARAIPCGDGRTFDVEFTLDIECLKPIEHPVIWVMLANTEGNKIMGATTRRQPGFLPTIDGKHRIRCTMRSLPLMPMLYQVMAGVFDNSLLPLDRWGNCATLVIDPREGAKNLITPEFDGSINVDAEWDTIPVDQEPSHGEVAAPAVPDSAGPTLKDTQE